MASKLRAAKEDRQRRHELDSKTSQTRRAVVGVFFETCFDAFSFLIEEFGFQRGVKKTDSRSGIYRVWYQSNTTGVEVWLEWREQRIYVELFRLVDGRPKQNPIVITPESQLNQFDLEGLLAIREPRLKLSSRATGEALTVGSVQLFVTQYAAALRQVGADILRGDFTIFRQLETIVQSRVRTKSSGQGLDPAKSETKARYDVFISYNSDDREEVRKIVTQLRQSGIIPWFDIESLRPGTPWLRQLEEQIEQIACAAVFIGKSGVSPWQREEMEMVLRRFMSSGRPIIPVILASARIDSRPPVFLANRTWIDFRSASPPPLGQLVRDIAGIRP